MCKYFLVRAIAGNTVKSFQKSFERNEKIVYCKNCHCGIGYKPVRVSTAEGLPKVVQEGSRRWKDITRPLKNPQHLAIGDLGTVLSQNEDSEYPVSTANQLTVYGGTTANENKVWSSTI